MLQTVNLREVGKGCHTVDTSIHHFLAIHNHSHALSHALRGYLVSLMMVFDDVLLLTWFPVSAAAGHIARSDPGGRGSVHSEARNGSWSASKRSSGVCAARAQRILSAIGSQHAKGHRAAS